MINSKENALFALVFHEHPRALALDRGGREIAADEEHRPAGETSVVLEAHWAICSPNALFWALWPSSHEEALEQQEDRLRERLWKEE